MSVTDYQIVIQMLTRENPKNPDPYIDFLLHLPASANVISNCFRSVTAANDPQEKENCFMLAVNLIIISEDISQIDPQNQFLDICTNYTMDLTTYDNYARLQKALEKYNETVNLHYIFPSESHFLSFLKVLNMKDDRELIQKTFLFLMKNIIDNFNSDICNITDLYALTMFCETQSYHELLLEFQQLDQKSPFEELMVERMKKLINLLNTYLNIKGLCRHVTLRLVGAIFHFLEPEDALFLNSQLSNILIKISNEDFDPMTSERIISLISSVPAYNSNDFPVAQQVSFYLSLISRYIQSPTDPGCDAFKQFLLLRCPPEMEYHVEVENEGNCTIPLDILSFHFETLITQYYKPVQIICQICNLFSRSDSFLELCFNDSIICNMKQESSESGSNFLKRKNKMFMSIVSGIVYFMNNLKNNSDDKQSLTENQASILLNCLFKLSCISDIMDIQDNKIALAKSLDLFGEHPIIFAKLFIQYCPSIQSNIILEKCVSYIKQYKDEIITYKNSSNRPLSAEQNYVQTIVQLLILLIVQKNVCYQQAIIIISGLSNLYSDELISIKTLVEFVLQQDQKVKANEYLQKKIRNSGKSDNSSYFQILCPVFQDNDELIKQVLPIVLKCQNINIFVVFFEIYSFTNEKQCSKELHDFVKKKLFKSGNANLFTLYAVCNILMKKELSRESKESFSDIINTIIINANTTQLTTSYYHPLEILIKKNKVIWNSETYIKLLETFQLSRLIPYLIKHMETLSATIIEKAAKSVFKYIEKAYKPIDSSSKRNQPHVIDETDNDLFLCHKQVIPKIDEQLAKCISISNYSKNDSKSFYQLWANCLFQNNDDELKKEIFNIFNKSAKNAILTATEPSFILITKIMKKMHRNSIEINFNIDCNILLIAAENCLKGGIYSNIACKFISLYFKKKLVVNESFGLNSALINYFSRNIPSALYGELLSKCTEGIPKLHHAILYCAILSNQDNANQTSEFLNSIVGVQKSPKIEPQVYSLMIEKCSEFINNNVELTAQKLYKYEVKPFLRQMLTRTILLRKDTDKGIFYSKFYENYFNYILTTNDDIEPDTVASDLISIIADFDPAYSILSHYVGSLDLLITAFLGRIHFSTTLKPNIKSALLNQMNSIMKSICYLSDIPKFSESSSIDDFSALTTNCQIIAQSILRNQVLDSIKKFMEYVNDLFSSISQNCLATISAVTLFIWSTFLSIPQGDLKHQDVSSLRSIISAVASKALQNGNCNFLIVCASQIFTEDVLNKTDVDVKNSYTVMLSKYLSNTTNTINAETAKLYCRLVKKENINTKSMREAFKVCPEEVLNTLINLKVHDIIEIPTALVYYLKLISDSNVKMGETAMKYIQFEGNSNDKAVITNKAVRTFEVGLKLYETIGTIKGNAVSIPIILEWICCILESTKMAVEHKEETARLALKISIKYHEENEKYMISRFISRLLKLAL